MQIYEHPAMELAMFYEENVAVTASSQPPTSGDPNNPGGGGIQMPDNTVNINDI